MKFFKNASICLASLSIALLTGCLSVDEMLECKDPGIHRRGEERAVEIITDPTAQSTKDEKLALIDKLSNQALIAQAYLRCRSSPELQKVLKEKITGEEGYAVILLSRTAPADERENALTKIKSDALRIKLAEILLQKSASGQDKLAKEYAKKLVADLQDEQYLVKFLIKTAPSMRKLERAGYEWHSGKAMLRKQEQMWSEIASNIKKEESVQKIRNAIQYEIGDGPSDIRDALNNIERKIQQSTAERKREEKLLTNKVVIKTTAETIKRDHPDYILNATGQTSTDDTTLSYMTAAHADTRLPITIGMPISEINYEIRHNEGTPETFLDYGNYIARSPSNDILNITYDNKGIVVGTTYLGEPPFQESYSTYNEGAPVKYWFHNGFIIVAKEKKVQVRNLNKMDKRLPSSFFAIEGIRLGMTEDEVEFVINHIRLFKNSCGNEKGFPSSYDQSEICKFFPNITISTIGTNIKRYAFGFSGPLLLRSLYWENQVYYIERHYEPSDVEDLGGAAELEKRLSQRLGCKAQHHNEPNKLNSLIRPSVKPLEFDERLDPYMTWDIPEKDLHVELHEIHSYNESTIPARPETVACDLIIRSISLTNAKRTKEKSAAKSKSAGF